MDVVVVDHRQASSVVISQLIKGELNFRVKNCVGPNEIIDHMHMRQGVNISYAKAQRAREFVLASLRGSPKESYQWLTSYLFMLKSTNPGNYYFSFR